MNVIFNDSLNVVMAHHTGFFTGMDQFFAGNVRQGIAPVMSVLSK
jgi:hypothetical protein